MGHIDSLTVMSADGASDIVRNATRAMIESTTAIKGLTGLDVPNLVGNALGRGLSDRARSGGDGGGDGGGVPAGRGGGLAPGGAATKAPPAPARGGAGRG